MKHPAKTLLSLLLCAVLLAAAFVPAAAAASPVTPVIVVSGMNSFPLYSGETGERVWGPQTKTILSMVGRILWPTVKALLKGDMEQLADDTFDDVYQSLFEVLSCDATGEPLHPIDAVTFPQSVDHYPDELLEADETEDEIAVVKTAAKAVGAEHVYFFNYDWRLDPRDDAKALHSFIENVKREQNAAKVTLVPCSMGGAVVNSLLSIYGAADIQKIVCCLVASKGIDMVGELFGRNVEIDMHVLLERLFNFENGNLALQALLSVLQGGFELNPLLTKALTKLLQSILDKTNERAYRDILLRSFATMPGLWAFVPDRYYEADKKIMFTGDHVLFDITPNITHWQGFEDSLGSYLDQLRRVRDIPVRLALPGHRKTGDYRARIDSILDHHRRRINDALQIIEQHPGMSAYEIAGCMKWKIRAADWDSFPVVQKWFAVGECLSHLDYLLKRDRIRFEIAGRAKRYYLR